MAATCAQSSLGRRGGGTPFFLRGEGAPAVPDSQGGMLSTPRRREHPRLGGGSRAWARHTTCDARACTCTSSTTAPMTRPETLRASRAAHETQSGDGPSPSESATGHQAMRDGNQVPSRTLTSLDLLVYRTNSESRSGCKNAHPPTHPDPSTLTSMSLIIFPCSYVGTIRSNR